MRICITLEHWDDLRILLAVVRGGSITGGAHLLSLDQSTVSRRLQAFEARLDRRLFHDAKKRCHLTTFGEACVESARRMEGEAANLDQVLRINDLSFEGDVTIQTSDILSDRLLLSVTSDFLEAYPKINLRVSRAEKIGGRFDTDIAIVASNMPGEDNFGKKLVTATFATYATRTYIAQFGSRPEEMTWLNWDDGSPTPTWPALSPNIPNEKCRLRCTSVDSLLDATRMGLGATILPCFIGESDPQLARLHPGQIVSRREVWVLVQPNLRNVPKIRTFLDYLYREILHAKDIIEAD
jgi:DNA-binding transcriptional LysR family regulator